MKITTLNSSYLVVALGLAALLVTSEAQAQDIVWQAPQTITGDANLITPLNSNVTEFDAIVPNNPGQTVDGVVFNPSTGAGGASLGDSNINLTLSSGSWGGYAFNGPGGTSGFPTGPSASSAFSNLLGSGGVFAQGGTSGLLTLSNLTVGSTYDVQIFNFSSDGVVGSTSLTSANSVNIFDFDANGNGQYVTGSFVAVGTTELVALGNASGPFAPVVGAINVEEVNAAGAVPEPSTYAMLLGGVLALIFFNVRKRRMLS
jgi:hypothetical protein